MLNINVMNTLHLLGVVVWIGGMFFAHMALRPSAEAHLAPPERLPLLNAVLGRFFRWVWVAILLILGSGYGIFFGLLEARAALYVHVMQGLALVMIVLFIFIYFVPFRRLSRALSEQNIPQAGAQMAIIRRIIGTNLGLGLVTTVIGAGKFF